MEEKKVMKNALHQRQTPYSAEGVSMEAVSHMTARSATSVTERNREQKCHRGKTITLAYKTIYEYNYSKLPQFLFPGLES